MKYKTQIFYVFLILGSIFFVTNFNNSAEDINKNDNQEKIVTIGGSITEIVFGLGLGDLVIAVDQSSTIPSIVKDLPQVGYIRKISSEGVLSMMPSMVLTNTEIGPEIAVNEIKSSGINMKIYNAPKNLNELKKNIIDIANEFNANDNAVSLIASIEKTKMIIDQKIKSQNKKQNMVFIMNPSNSSYTVAGANTTADFLINVMGGNNIFSENFSYYRNVNKEELIKSNPDVVLIATHYDSTEAIQHFTNNVDFKNLNSVKNKNIIPMPLSNLTMGPSFIENAYKNLLKINFNEWWF